jgi:hypothetical protein
MECSQEEVSYSTAYTLHVDYCHKSRITLPQNKNFIFYEIKENSVTVL